MSIEFLVVSFIVVASPGTGVLTTLAAGLARGTRVSLLAAFGCTLGILPHLLAAISGLAVLLHASAVAFEAIKYAGVAYLFYMAWLTLKADGPLSIDVDATPRSSRQVVWTAILVNLLNPKLSIFFVAFLPQFVGADAPSQTVRMLELSGWFMLMTFVVFAIYGWLAASVRDRVIARPRVLLWLRRSFAAAFVGLGARLVLTER